MQNRAQATDEPHLIHAGMTVVPGHMRFATPSFGGRLGSPSGSEVADRKTFLDSDHKPGSRAGSPPKSSSRTAASRRASIAHLRSASVVDAMTKA